VLRERDAVLRDLVAALRGDFEAPVEALFARAVDDLRAPVERPAPDVDDLADDVRDFVPLLFARDELARELAGLARAPDVLDRDALVLRAPPLFDEDDAPDVLAPDPSAAVHFPDMTRCAASATASAMSEPSLVALAITLVAAWLAVSAASRPASRIARLALGLALIAAAAAARPAASISLLIAAFAILSTVSLLEDDPEEFLRADLAIVHLPTLRQKTLYARNGSRMNSEVP
jgi:hypothetical protein